MLDPRAYRAGLFTLGLLLAAGGTAALIRARYTEMGLPRLISSTALLALGLLCVLVASRRPPT